MDVYTIPSEETLAEIEKQVPKYMRPNALPHCVIGVQVLSMVQCSDILKFGMRLDPYVFGSCGAETREYNQTLHPSLNPIITFAQICNERYWQFDLDAEPMAWLQTYEEGGDYHIHTDSAIGQSRKLTAVALLSSERAYEGGRLELLPTQEEYQAPKYGGTIVVFPSWIPHRVTPITQGLRQSINLGFFGPPFH